MSFRRRMRFSLTPRAVEEGMEKVLLALAVMLGRWRGRGIKRQRVADGSKGEQGGGGIRAMA